MNDRGPVDVYPETINIAVNRSFRRSGSLIQNDSIRGIGLLYSIRSTTCLLHLILG